MTTTDYTTERARLVKDRAGIVGEASALATRCASRAFTTGEEVDALDMKRRADDLDRQLADLDAGEQRRRTAAEQTRTDRKAADAQIKAAIAALGADIGLDDTEYDVATGAITRVGGTSAIPRAKAARSAWSTGVADRLVKQSSAHGIKALVAGSIDVPVPLTADVVALPDQPRRVIDLLVERTTLTGPTFEFLRQTARSSLAGTVPDGATSRRRSSRSSR